MYLYTFPNKDTQVVTLFRRIDSSRSVIWSNAISDTLVEQSIVLDNSESTLYQTVLGKIYNRWAKFTTILVFIVKIYWKLSSYYCKFILA